MTRNGFHCPPRIRTSIAGFKVQRPAVRRKGTRYQRCESNTRSADYESAALGLYATLAQYRPGDSNPPTFRVKAGCSIRYELERCRCRSTDSNRHGRSRRGLSPLCLPFHQIDDAQGGLRTHRAARFERARFAGFRHLREAEHEAGIEPASRLWKSRS